MGRWVYTSLIWGESFLVREHRALPAAFSFFCPSKYSLNALMVASRTDPIDPLSSKMNSISKPSDPGLVPARSERVETFRSQTRDAPGPWMLCWSTCRATAVGAARLGGLLAVGCSLLVIRGARDRRVVNGCCSAGSASGSACVAAFVGRVEAVSFSKALFILWECNCENT